jgi:hypothetical protein
MVKFGFRSKSAMTVESEGEQMKPLFYLNEDIRAFDEVIIYGSGQAGRGIFQKLLQRNVKVLCFADSNPDNCEQMIWNTPVRHISELAGKYGSAAFIVGGRYMYDVKKALEEMGVRHLFFDYANEVGVIHLGGEGDYPI